VGFETDCVEVDFISLSVLRKGGVCAGLVTVADANDCWAYDVWESYVSTNCFGWFSAGEDVVQGGCGPPWYALGGW
jgi:hypothetical protein